MSRKLKRAQNEEHKKDECDILLIHPPYHRRLGSGIIPPPGLAYLSSYLRIKGFKPLILDCSIFFDNLKKQTINKMTRWLRNKLASIKINLAIGIGPCTTSTVRAVYAIAKACEGVYPNKPLILGGPLTLIPGMDWLFFEKIKASAVIKGDGEIPLMHVLDKLRKGESISDIPGVQTEENQKVEAYFIENIDDLPFPAWDLFEMNCYRPSIRRDLFVYPFVPIIGSRGCLFKCSFCVSGQLIKYRRRSFGNIAKEAEHLRKNYNVRSLIFYDDSLFPYASKVNEEIRLLAELINKVAPETLWQIEIRPDIFSNISGDTFKYIYSKGCRQLNIGIESFSQSKLRIFRKLYSIEEFEETCKLVNDVCPRLRLTGTFILGGPGETLDSINETIESSTRLGLLFAHYYPLYLYPGTPLYERVFGQNTKEWFNNVISDQNPWGEVVYEDENISATQLMELVSFAYSYFYRRKEWRKRARYYLGNKYDEIVKIVKLWPKSRFRLDRRRQT